MTNALALVAATAVLVLIPGPNVALIVASSFRHGFRSGLLTAFGTTAGIALQLLLVVAGLVALLELAASALLVIKWAGAAYLVWLGIRTWREPVRDLQEVRPEPPAGIFWRGLGFAVVNPKTLLFNAAFLPQFVGEEGSASTQLFLLGMLYLAVIIAGDTLWAWFAAGARERLGRLHYLQNRMTGGLLCAAGLGLGISHRSS